MSRWVCDGIVVEVIVVILIKRNDIIFLQNNAHLYVAKQRPTHPFLPKEPLPP